MRILYHHRTQETGVEGVHINEITQALRTLGHQVDILSPGGVNKIAGDDIKKKKVFKLLSKSPEFLFELMELFYNFISYKKLSALLRQNKYDLLYERYAIFNLAGIKAAHRFGIPAILEVNYTSFMPLYRRRTRALKPLAHFIDRKILNQSDGLVVVSTYLKQHLLNLGIKESKIIVSTNAANPKKFNPSIDSTPIKKQYELTGKKVIGFVGGFYPWHGLEILVDCFIEIIGKYQDVLLFLIGDGPLKQRIETKIKESGLEKYVRFTGSINHNNLPDYIAAFDIAVMPDSNEYGSPMKIYEYMAMGKPVIAPCLGPLEDGINDGKEGILFKQNDKKALINAITKLLTCDGYRNEMGQNAIKKVLSNHTWEINAQDILNLMASVKWTN